MSTLITFKMKKYRYDGELAKRYLFTQVVDKPTYYNCILCPKIRNSENVLVPKEYKVAKNSGFSNFLSHVDSTHKETWEDHIEKIIAGQGQITNLFTELAVPTFARNIFGWLDLFTQCPSIPLLMTNNNAFLKSSRLDKVNKLINY